MVRSSNIRLKSRVPVIQLYNERLANSLRVQRQGESAKWILKDATSVALDELFEQLSEDVEEYLDLFADRSAHLGRIYSTRSVVSTWSHFLRTTRSTQSRVVTWMVAHLSQLAN